MGKAIVFTSGKGGTGKTTAVAAIASCLAATGHSTLCIDCDLGLGNLDLSLGIAGTAATHFGDVLSGRVCLEDAVCPHPRIPGLGYLAAPVTLTAEEISPAALGELVKEAKTKYEFVLLDSAAGIGSAFRLAKGLADMAVIVATWDASSQRDGQRAAAMLFEEDALGEIRLLLNRIYPRFLRDSRTTVDDLVDSIGVQLLGVVPEDRAVQLSVQEELALALYGSTGASRAFLRIAKRLAGEHIPLGKL